MPQEFLVVRCYSCQTFQNHQTRRDNKFVCKVCGLIQSRKKVYAEGNAKDCRLTVQNLNARAQQQYDEEISYRFSAHEDSCEAKDSELKIFGRSKWDEFLESVDDSLEKAGCSLENNCNKSPEMNLEESTSKVFGSSFTKVKRFHDGEIKNTAHKESKEEICDSNYLKSSLKECAFRKFQNINDNIFDTLNTSFYC